MPSLGRGWIALLCVLSFFNNFYHFYFFILCFYGCYFFSVYIFFMLIVILFWVWKIVLSTLFDYLPNALTLFLYITNLQRIYYAILIVGLKKRVKKIKKFSFSFFFFWLWIINNVKLWIGGGFFYGWFYSRIGC